MLQTLGRFEDWPAEFQSNLVALLVAFSNVVAGPKVLAAAAAAGSMAGEKQLRTSGKSWQGPPRTILPNPGAGGMVAEAAAYSGLPMALPWTQAPTGRPHGVRHGLLQLRVQKGS